MAVTFPPWAFPTSSSPGIRQSPSESWCVSGTHSQDLLLHAFEALSEGLYCWDLVSHSYPQPESIMSYPISLTPRQGHKNRDKLWLLRAPFSGSLPIHRWWSPCRQLMLPADSTALHTGFRLHFWTLSLLRLTLERPCHHHHHHYHRHHNQSVSSSSYKSIFIERWCWNIQWPDWACD